MEMVDMFEPVSGLEDLVQIIESFFADLQVWVRLEMQQERGEEVHDFLLAQFAGTFDMCDIVYSESEQEVGLEVGFLEVQEEGGEPHLITLPLDPQDVEVDLLEDRIVLQSGLFALTIQRMEK